MDNNLDKTAKIKEYQERYRFWTDKRISQLSFHNNFMLTLGCALIGYFWVNRSVYTGMGFLINAAGIIFIAVSILAGFILSLSRLYDARLTSNILLTRKRSTEKDVTIREPETSPSNFCRSISSLVEVILNYQYYEISDGDIQKNNQLSEKFNKLRQKSDDLGFLTWRLLIGQTITLFFGIFLLIISSIFHQ